jgi:hypothetical protein
MSFGAQPIWGGLERRGSVNGMGVAIKAEDELGGTLWHFPVPLRFYYLIRLSTWCYSIYKGKGKWE